MEAIMTAPFWIAVGQIILIDILLGGDADRRDYDNYRDAADGSATLADLFHGKDNG